jgi:nitrile hydratase
VDGIHDMGGMQGFGLVVPERDEPAFHEPWEGRVHGVAMALWAGDVPVGSLRRQIERIETVHYLTSSYYTHWQEALEAGLAQAGVIAPGEVEAWVERLAAGEPVPVRIDAGQAAATAAMLEPDEPAPPPGDAHRFAVGQTVRVRRISSPQHNRCPRYIRGLSGRIERLLAPAPLPENADTGGRAQAPGYTVAFRSADLWPQDGTDHEVLVDLWETYLEEDV